MDDLKKAKKLIKKCKETQSTYLNLGKCGITDLKELPELFECTHLKILTLNSNQISDISFLKDLKQLQSLDLGDNQISDISFLKDLKQLKTLELSNNQISDISFLKDLKQLQSLYLSSNQISDISFLKDLKQLQSLFLGNNQISDYSFLKNLTGLQYFFLWSNKISDISFLKDLKQLQTLYLRDNEISDISVLANLTKLQNLNLANNQIKELPLSIFQLNMEINMDGSIGEGLSLSGNPIESPPLEILKQGEEAVFRHFRRIEKEGGKNKLEYIYEAKLILVGKGNAGKTSLQKKLIDEKAQLPDSDKRTRGIEVVDFEFEKGKIAHIWDFGGQVIYYPVHRFFITKNAVFVLLASTREYDHNFEYWIPTIYQFGGQSPIILGQTCHEGLTIPWNNFGVNLNDSNFNIIKTSSKPYIEIDLTDDGKNRGLNEIKQDIITQIKKLPHFGKGVPPSWATVRNALLEKYQSVSYISFEAFVELCRQLEPVFLSKIEDITDCCQFFHDIGVLLWYSEIEELRDLVILKPDWAMNAVYKIIDNTHNGLIHKNDFDTLWDSNAYKDKHDILKKILEKFKIAFPAKHTRNQTYIFPAKLTSMPLEKTWEFKEDFLRLEYEFEFMPKGIVNQLSAELSGHIHEHDVWNDAVNLIRESSEAQIIEDSHKRKLSVISKGVDARGMNILIMEAIKNIIGEYKGVKAEIFVPCTCNSCRQSKNPTFFSYYKLLEWSFRGREEVTCNESGESLRIFKLLYNVGFDPSKIIVSKELKGIKHDTKKIFLASSEELKNDRKEFEIFIRQEITEYLEKGTLLDLIIWEDFIDRMSTTRSQDEYNKAVINSDIFIGLFWTKTGKYTKEEFGEAYNHFKNTGKPSIYTYFKNTPVNPKDWKKDDADSLHEFKEELKKLEYFPPYYENIADLKYQFKKQLDKLLKL